MRWTCAWMLLLAMVNKMWPPMSNVLLLRHFNRVPLFQIYHGVHTVQQWQRQNTNHYNDVIMSAVTSEITGILMICSTVWSGADQRKHQSSLSLAFVRGIHRWPVNSPHKGPVTRKVFPLFDDVIMQTSISQITPHTSRASYIWDIYCEDLGENWPRCNSVTLYIAEYRQPKITTLQGHLIIDQ